MTNEEKELLLKDLCTRLPYKTKINVDDTGLFIPRLKCIDIQSDTCHFYECAWIKFIDEIKPYLRPMSSMTEEEKEIYKRFCDEDIRQLTYVQEVHPSLKQKTSCHHSIDWLNAHHFDYRGLIEKGLALPATKEMYK